MNTKDLMQTEISFYGKVRYNKAYKRIKLIEWLSTYQDKYKSSVLGCRSVYEDKEQYKKMKTDNLPCVTLSAVFDEFRNIRNVTKQNPIIAVDIDGQDNPDIIDWDKVKKDVFKIKGVFLSSLSCSGRGVYVLVHYDMNLNYEDVFRALQHDFRELGLIIDKNCKDITRLRFISYDNNMMCKYSDIEPYDKTESKENNNEYISAFNGENPIKEDDMFIFKAIHHLITKCKYRADDYFSWLQDGFRLATLGKLGYVLFMELSQLSKGYNEESANDKWKEVCRTTHYDRNSLIYYYGKLKQIYGESKWKQIISSDIPLNETALFV